MNQINKIMGQIGMVAALLAFVLVLAGSISTDAYSVAAEVQARADLALLQIGDASTQESHGTVAAASFGDFGQTQEATK